MDRGIYLLTHMSTGSTWLMHLLHPFFNGTEGGSFIRYNSPDHKKVIHMLDNKYIIKAHRWTHGQVFNLVGTEYGIVSIVRNPLDRFTSVYYRLDRTQNATYRKVIQDCFFTKGGDTQLERMEEGFSTRTRHLNTSELPYIWTTYEWLHSNTKRELKAILDFFNIRYTNMQLRHALELGNKNTKTSSNFRKGIVGDWKNFIPEKDVKRLMPFYNKYEEIIKNEENSRSNNDIR